MNNKKTSRRDFIKITGTAGIGGAVAMGMGLPQVISSLNIDDELRVGLVGCGGRGTGAAIQALNADSNTVLYAVCDIFQDRMNEAVKAAQSKHDKRVQVDDKRKFKGFDGYLKVIESVDVVILATTPYFRPVQLEACIEAGKHVFYEKPVAVDAPGIRKIIAASKKAKEKNLSLVSGLCFRHEYTKQALFERILKGEIGDVKVANAIRYGGYWHEPEQNSDWTEMEYKIRNWYYFDWLSGDFNVEQFVHSMDMISWALNDEIPVKAIGSGGRQQRTDQRYGNIYDHFSTSFEYEDEKRVFTSTRQQKDVSGKDSVEIYGTIGNGYYKGNTHKITGENEWKFNDENNNMFQEEHDFLFDSIRNDKGANDAERAANSTMMAILSRMVAYSGKSIMWDEAINSEKSLGPEAEEVTKDLKYDEVPVPIPGKTKVI